MAKDLFKVRYDHVISFGATCGCAMHMLRHGLRNCSLPLDWMGVEQIGWSGTVDLVCGGFKDYLLLENLVPYDGPQPPHAEDRRTDIYFDQAWKIISAHDFRKGVPLAEQYDKVMDKVHRRQARLMALLAEPSKKLVLFRDIRGEEDDAIVLAAARRLKAAFPEGTTNVVYLRNRVGFAGFERRDLAPDVVVFDGWFHRKDAHVSLGDIALNDRVFSRIRARGKYLNILKDKLAAWRRRLKTQLHFSAAARRAARKALAAKAGEGV